MMEGSNAEDLRAIEEHVERAEERIRKVKLRGAEKAALEELRRDVASALRRARALHRFVRAGGKHG